MRIKSSTAVFSKLVCLLLLITGAVSLCMAQGIINLPATLASATAKLEGVKTGLAYSEGPAVDSSGNLFFSEMASAQMKIWKVTPKGNATVFRTGDYFNGNEFDSQGRLVFCELDKITRLNSSGGVDVLSKTGDNGFSLLRTNDLSIATTGAMFFTNHSSGKSLFYRSTSGTIKRWTGFPTPNGVEWIEEKGFLYLCLSDTNMVMTYSVAADGSISNGKKFVSIAVPDGITLDERYNVYVACHKEGKVYVFDSTGKALGTITVQGSSTAQGNVSNCIFGGTDNKTLYITGNGGAYKVNLLVAGRKKGGIVSAIAPIYHATGSTKHRNKAVADGIRYDLCGRAVARTHPMNSRQRLLRNDLHGSCGVIVSKTATIARIEIR